jgi:hypothetical protein
MYIDEQTLKEAIRYAFSEIKTQAIINNNNEASKALELLPAIEEKVFNEIITRGWYD